MGLTPWYPQASRTKRALEGFEVHIPVPDHRPYRASKRVNWPSPEDHAETEQEAGLDLLTNRVFPKP